MTAIVRESIVAKEINLFMQIFDNIYIEMYFFATKLFLKVAVMVRKM
jgi:hypothetical protein